MPVTLTTLSSSLVKVRWKEPYASESLNRKFTGAIAPGVYRGLIIGTSASALSVDLAPDPTIGDHVAVQEDSTGFSTTFTDDTSGTFTLDLSSYATNDVVVVTLAMAYAVGTDTTAEFRGYTLAEYNGLSAAAQRSLVVLGTVLRPASGIIPAANIVYDRRTLPFQNRSDGLIPWVPLLRNGGFELGETNGTYRHASPFWKTSTTNANFLIRPVTTEARTGSKSLEMTNSGGAGAVTATIQQDLWMPVVAGRYVMARLYKKALQAASGVPSGTLRFVFGDQDGTNDVNDDLIFAVNAIDGSFVEFDGIVKVPTASRVLKSIQIIINGSYSSTGPCIRFDDVQAWSQGDAGNWMDVRDARVAEGAVGDLFIGQQNSFANNAAKVWFDGTNLIVDRRNESTTAIPPAISIQARTSGGITYTLVFQSLPTGVPGYRKYVSSTGTMVETINASWNNGTNLWSKDVSGTVAQKFEERPTGRSSYSRIADATWADSAWVQYLQNSYTDTTTNTNQVFAPILMTRDQAGNQRVALDHLGLRAGRVTVIHQTWMPPMLTAWSTLASSGGTNTQVFSDANIPGPAMQLFIANSSSRAGWFTGFITSAPMGTNQLHMIEWELSCAALVGTPNIQMQMGFMHDESGDPTSENYAKFSKTSASANWFLNTQGNTTGTNTVNTGIAAGGLQRFRLEYYGNGLPGGLRCIGYINGALVAMSASNMPDSSQSMSLSFAMKATGTVSNQSVVLSPISYTVARYLADDAL